MKEKKYIAVVGLGYVGLPLALLASKKGYKVLGIDLDVEKLDKIRNKESPFVDKYVSKQLKRQKISVTDDFKQIKNVNIIIICVPTPIYENRLPNYEPVQNACRAIGPYLQKKQLVILESTVNPGVSEEIILPILEKFSGLVCGKDFYLAHCPERINPGDKKWGVWNIPRVVGGYDKKSLNWAVNFYRSIVDGNIKPMNSLKEAEAVKVTENSFRNVNIAFVNELAKSFAKLGIDVVNVINGASTKPFSFLAHYPGCGIGGHCIPVDPYYLIDYAKKNGFEHEFLKLSCKINEGMPEYTVGLLQRALETKGKNIRGSRVAVLGLSYKANIDDTRESPSFVIIEHLKRLGAIVKTYDPFVLHASTVKTLDTALTDVDGVIVATNHGYFKKELTFEKLLSVGVDVLIDGKNCLDKSKMVKKGINYFGIGR